MSKNNKPSPPRRLKQGQDKYQLGYQPAVSKLSPEKPPSNPPNKQSSGRK